VQNGSSGVSWPQCSHVGIAPSDEGRHRVHRH
jgi:hypothetical protein